MGVVYRAIQLRLERPVALKVMAPELARDARFRQLKLSAVARNAVQTSSTGSCRGGERLAVRTPLQGNQA